LRWNEKILTITIKIKMDSSNTGSNDEPRITDHTVNVGTSSLRLIKVKSIDGSVIDIQVNPEVIITLNPI
jgi:hypothetical protein